MKRLLITGTRHGWDYYDLADGLTWSCHELGEPYNEITLVHGDARGVDKQAAAIWESWGFPTEAHPAPWDKFPSTGGNIRNSEMVYYGADLCIAFPAIGSRGTYDCMRKAAQAGIRVVDWSEGLTDEPTLW